MSNQAESKIDASTKKGLSGLVIGSLGVVFGDLGTSPLYAMREALAVSSHDGLERAEIFGIVSLVLWTLTLLVTIKYLFFVMRLDNKGEGGILALQALAQRSIGRTSVLISFIGITGAALFYGDAILTPAISILSAVEGLKVPIPSFDKKWAVPISLVIIIGLFAMQSKGTKRLSHWFGPIMLAWFLAIGLLGIPHIFSQPTILSAFNPIFGIRFLLTHGVISFFVLGAIFLCVTGAEALYADLGHFGRKPINIAWTWIVFPALALNYLGQGALVLSSDAAVENPFFMMSPDWFQIPLVILATLATIIASQAIITGAFSLTQQAVQLCLLPRLEICHTSADQQGQIYVPAINILVGVGVVLLVLGFQTSSALASAYGLAVTGTMLMTTMLAYFVVTRLWRWPSWRALIILGPLGLLELIFLGANLMKLLDGAWFSLILGVAIYVIMSTWMRGTKILLQQNQEQKRTLPELVKELVDQPIQIVPGAAVFMTSDSNYAPPCLLANLKHNHVLHDKTVVVVIKTADMPHVPQADRAKVEQITSHITKITLHFGFMETPDMPRAMSYLRHEHQLDFRLTNTSYFLLKRIILPSKDRGMPLWQDYIYVALSKIASHAADYFHIPRDRTIEIGEKLTL